MQSILDQIKSLASKFRSSKISYIRDSVNPQNDWVILLIATFIILVVMAGVSFYVYTQIDQGMFFAVAPETGANEIKINTTLLQKTIEDINLRATNFSALIQNKPVVADPSR